MNRNHGRAILFAPGLVALVIFSCAFSYTRTIHVETTPPGATVYLTNQPVGVTPLTQKIEFNKVASQIEVRVEKDGYAPESRVLTGQEAKDMDKRALWNINFELFETRRDIPVSITSPVAGSTVLLNGKPLGTVPLKRTLVFSRVKGGDWSAAALQVEKPPYYHPSSRTISAEDAVEALKTSAEWQLNFPLAEIRRDLPVEIKANIEGASVSIDGQPLGTAPVKHTLVFTRTDASSPWSEATLKVEKESFEHRPPGADGQPAYIRKITVDDAAGGTFAATDLVPVRFVLTPVRMFEVQPEKILIVKTNLLSEVNEAEPGKPPTQITTAKAEAPLALCRISAVPDHPDQIAFTIPKREERVNPGDQADDEIVGANIWMVSGVAQTQMSEGRQFDIDPFVTADGKWIYFSSNRLRTRAIWRMPANGKGGFTKITGDLSTVDTEPAVSPDGSKLAYTSRSPNAMSLTPSYIWIANNDGSLPTQMRAGHSPAWSPDGNHIAFVSPENKIWVMDTDGGNPTQLTLGDSIEANPVWTPTGKHIVFASDRAQNDLKQKNYDIWISDADGSKQTQLTSNGSFDASPAISSDGKYLYFFSNRGAQRTGQESLQIFRLELPSEYAPAK
jgi:Tol biopolymer transport system component